MLAFRHNFVSFRVHPAGSAGDLKRPNVPSLLDQHFERDALRVKVAGRRNSNLRAVAEGIARFDGCDVEFRRRGSLGKSRARRENYYTYTREYSFHAILLLRKSVAESSFRGRIVRDVCGTAGGPRSVVAGCSDQSGRESPSAVPGRHGAELRNTRNHFSGTRKVPQIPFRTVHRRLGPDAGVEDHRDVEAINGSGHRCPFPLSAFGSSYFFGWDVMK